MRNTKENRLAEREAWISGQPTTKYKDLEFMTKDESRFTLTVWRGTAGKPCSNFYYPTKEQRQMTIDSMKKRANEREAYIKEQKDKKKEIVKHDLKKGNMFVTSWGYDQTNYDYIVVMEVSPSGKTAKCQMTSSLNHGQKVVISLISCLSLWANLLPFWGCISYADKKRVS